MGDPEDSEVTSSSHSQVIIADVIVNPEVHHHSGHSVDLDLWDLDLNSVYGDPTTSTTTEVNSNNINLLISSGGHNNNNNGNNSTLTTLTSSQSNNVPPGGGLNIATTMNHPIHNISNSNSNATVAAKRNVNRVNSLAVSSFSDSSSGTKTLLHCNDYANKAGFKFIIRLSFIFGHSSP